MRHTAIRLTIDEDRLTGLPQDIRPVLHEDTVQGQDRPHLLHQDTGLDKYEDRPLIGFYRIPVTSWRPYPGCFSILTLFLHLFSPTRENPLARAVRLLN